MYVVTYEGDRIDHSSHSVVSNKLTRLTRQPQTDLLVSLGSLKLTYSSLESVGIHLLVPSKFDSFILGLHLVNHELTRHDP
jgi:hypothetical protein